MHEVPSADQHKSVDEEDIKDAMEDEDMPADSKGTHYCSFIRYRGDQALEV